MLYILFNIEYDETSSNTANFLRVIDYLLGAYFLGNFVATTKIS